MTKISIKTFGDLYFEKQQGSELNYRSIIEDYLLDDAAVYLKINCSSLDENTVEKIDEIIGQLSKMNIVARQAYLDDFNDEEEDGYVSRIYKRILSTEEFELLNQQTNAEQRLLFAINISYIEINIKNEGTSTRFQYIKGYELEHNYKFNENCELKELVFRPLSGIVKEQLYKFIDKWESPEVNEICSRFNPDWMNSPARSYHIYRMVVRIKGYLKNNAI
jgi:hypothetical protein